MNSKIQIMGVVAMLLLLAGLIAGSYFLLKAGILDKSKTSQIVVSNFIDLKDIQFVSKFRSNAGKSFTDKTLKCASMKNIFEFNTESKVDVLKPDSLMAKPTEGKSVDIYSPIDSVISKVEESESGIGSEIYLESSSDSSLTVVIFKVFPEEKIKKGVAVKASDKIGTIHKGQIVEITVQKKVGDEVNYSSIFEYMTDEVFQEFVGKGIDSRSDFVLSQEYRMKNPLKCDGDFFSAENYNGVSPRKEWVELR